MAKIAEILNNVVSDSGVEISSLQPLLTNPVTGTGTTNYIPKFTGTSAIGNSDLITDGSGNLAIAQGNAPTQALNIYRAGSTQTVMAAGNSNTGLNGTYFGVDPNGNGIINTTGAFANIFSTNGSERMRITSGGDIGIGTTAPSYKLDVQEVIRSKYGSNEGSLYLGGTPAGVAYVAGAVRAAPSPSYSYTGKLSFYTTTWGVGTDYGITEQMYIETSTSDTKAATIVMLPWGGKVGIGTTSPDAIFHVAKSTSGGVGGQIVIDNPSGSALGNTAELSFLTDAGASGAGTRNARIQAVNENVGNGAANMQFWTWNGSADAERMRITSAGDILVAGTYNPYTAANRGNITLNGTSGNVIGFANGTTPRGFIFHDGTNLEIANSLSNPILFATAGNERMRITSSGNVGIGTSSPSFKLDIFTAQSIRVFGSSTGYTQGSIIFQSSTTDTPQARGLGVYAFNEGTDATWFYGTGYNAADTFVINRKAGIAYEASAAAPGESSNFFAITNTGNIGVGTTSPANRLDIRSASGSDAFAFVSGGAGATKGGLYLGNNGGQYGSLWFDNATNDVVLRQNYNNGNLIFGTNFTERMRITSGGQLLVGVTSGINNGMVHAYAPSGNQAFTAQVANNAYSLFQGFNAAGSATFYVTGAGNIVGSGSISMSGSASIGSYLYLASEGTGSVIGDVSTGNYLRFLVSNTERMRITSSGNVMVGVTTDSGYKLDINGTALIRGNVYTGGENGIEIGWINSTINDQRIGRIRPISTPTQNPYAGGLAFDYYKYSGTQYQFYEGMRLTGSGNVGIGTTSPTNKFEITHTISSNTPDAIAQFGSAGSGNWANSGHQVVIGGPSVLGYTGLILYSDNITGSGQISFADGRGANDSWRGSVSYDHSVDAMVFGTNATEKVRITSSGNVGIGTSSPANKLQIGSVGSTGFGGNDIAIGNGSQVMTFYQSATISTWYTNTSFSLMPSGVGAVGNVGIGTTSPSNRLTVSGNADITGNVGIGTTGPVEKLDVRGKGYFNNGGVLYLDANASNTILATTGARPLLFEVNSAERMRITSGGNVGIGTSNPTTKLHVVGTSTFTDEAYFTDKLGVGTVSLTYKAEVAGATGNYWNGSAFTGTPLALAISNTQPGGYDPVLLYRQADSGGTIKLAGGIGLVGTGPWTAGNDGTQVSDMYFLVRNSGGSISERMRIKSGGNVLIGNTTNNDNAQLYVRRPDASNGALTYTIAWFQNATGYQNGLAIKATDNLLTIAADNSSSVAGSSAGLAFATNSTSSANNATERMRITPAGNVGIGTSSPGYKLETIGSARISGNLSIGTTYNGFAANIEGVVYVINGPVWTTDGYGYANASATTTGMFPDSGNNITFKTNNNTRVYVTSAGNVGIGTTSPGSPLSVAGAGGSTLGSNGYIVHVGGTDSSVDPVRYMIGFSHGSVLSSSNVRAGIGMIVTSGGAGNLVFETGSGGAGQTERMRINGSGNVGIGTVSPTEKLDINGGVVVRSSSGNNDLKFIAVTRPSIYVDSTNIGLQLRSNGTAVLQLNNDNAATGDVDINNGVIRVQASTSRVGIGTTSPDTRTNIVKTALTKSWSTDVNDILAIENNGTTLVDIRSSNAEAGYLSFSDGDARARGLITYSHASDDMRFNTAGSERMRITNGGIVGIGTSSPDASTMLQVQTSNSCSVRIVSSALSGGDLYLTSVNSGSESRIDKQGTAGPLTFYNNGSERMRITSSGNTELTGSIKTGAPSGGTAAAWKLGSRISNTCGLPATYADFTSQFMNTNKVIEIEIGGVTVYVPTVTPGWC